MKGEQVGNESSTSLILLLSRLLQKIIQQTPTLNAFLDDLFFDPCNEGIFSYSGLSSGEHIFRVHSYIPDGEGERPK